MTVLDILLPRFHPLQLKGFRNGYFDEKKNTLFAYTLLPVNDDEYDTIYRFYLKGKGGGFSKKIEEGKEPDERRYSNYNDDGSYWIKDTEQLVAEGVLKFVSIEFYGALYKGEWYIRDGGIYFEDDDEKKVIHLIEERWQGGAGILPTGYFKIVPEFEEEIDYGQVSSMLSAGLNKKIKAADMWDMMFEFIVSLSPSEVPGKQRKQSVHFREFIGQPWLVAYLKQERKSNINRSFEAYINEAVFLPFIQILRVNRQDEFSETQTLCHPGHYPLIYPHTKEQVLCVVKVVNKAGASRLYYFLYVCAQKRFFEWTKPTPRSADGHHSFYIQEDLKDLSSLGEDFALYEPSVTMDDNNFWKGHVFKKKEGHYLYLKEIGVTNNQPDIYPDL